MKTDVNGCSTCLVGQEQYEESWVKHHRFCVKSVQYEYRHTNGNLFSCVAINLYVARQKRDAWVKAQEAMEHEAESFFFKSHPELNP